MVQLNVPVYFEQEAVITKITNYFVFVQLKDGPVAMKSDASDERETYSLLVSNVRTGGPENRQPLTSMAQSGLSVGDVVRVSYALLPDKVPVMLVLTTGAGDKNRPTLIQIQDMGNELVRDGSSIQKRIAKTIEAPMTTDTPAHLKSAISIKSPIDMRDVLVQHQPHSSQYEDQEADLESVVGSEDSEASR